MASTTFELAEELTGWKGESSGWNSILYLGSLELRPRVPPNIEGQKIIKSRPSKGNSIWNILIWSKWET